YDRNAKVLGTVPWDARQTATWSSDGRFLCAAVPDRATTGAQMRLETAVIGQPAKIIASGFMTYADNGSYRVLACDQSSDRAVVASFGQGVAPARSSLTTAVIEWKTGRTVWSAGDHPYGGFLVEPAGRRLVVGIGFVGGLDVRDVYLVSPDGSAVLLPAQVRVALLY